ncbi:MAG: VOC family protein [Verrucomicrobia bacterium]|nr:VOC family protein [Verrucomicrobiota bacterium]
MSEVKPIPDGYHSVTPYLLTSSVADLLAFTVKALGAEVTQKTEMPDGTVSHAEVQIGDSRVMMGQTRDEWPPMPTMLYLYVEDCDAAYTKAIAAGAESVMEPADQFYGDRSGGVLDALGNQWWFGTRIENIPPDELAKRMQKARS